MLSRNVEKSKRIEINPLITNKMKSTKIMLAVIFTAIGTWTLMSLIGYFLSDSSLRECYTHGATLMLMLIFGWIPAVIIACDLDKQLEDN